MIKQRLSQGLSPYFHAVRRGGGEGRGGRPHGVDPFPLCTALTPGASTPVSPIDAVARCLCRSSPRAHSAPHAHMCITQGAGVALPPDTLAHAASTANVCQVRPSPEHGPTGRVAYAVVYAQAEGDEKKSPDVLLLLLSPGQLWRQLRREGGARLMEQVVDTCTCLWGVYGTRSVAKARRARAGRPRQTVCYRGAFPVRQAL